MLFMSAEHVSAMNDLLSSSDEVRSAIARLDRTYVLAYDLSAAPDGGSEHWTMTLGPDGVRFDLDAPAGAADIVTKADYSAMIRATKASRAGERADEDIAVDGDPTVLERIAPVLALAQQVATLDVQWPDV